MMMMIVSVEFDLTGQQRCISSSMTYLPDSFFLTRFSP